MRGLARFMLVLTALGPVLLVHGLSLWFIDRERALIACGGAALLVLVCVGLLRHAARRLGRNSFRLEQPRSVDAEILPFVVTYLLPLFTQKPGETDYLTLGGVLALIGLLTYQSGMYHVNPLIAILGYHFCRVGKEPGPTFLLLTRHDNASAARDVTAVWLGRDLWLEV